MKLSRKDVFFLSVRLTIMISLVYTLGPLIGAFIVQAYFGINWLVMKLAFNLETVSPVDTLLVHDDDKNVANVVSKRGWLSLSKSMV